jgi:hypothetical protein
MPGTKTVKVEGKTYRVPDNATPDEIDEIAGGKQPASAAPSPLADRALNWVGEQFGHPDVGEGFSSTLGRELSSAGEFVKQLPSSLYHSVVDAPKPGAESDIVKYYGGAAGPALAIHRNITGPAYEAAKWYAGDEPNKIERALSVAPEAMGQAAPVPLLGKIASDFAGLRDMSMPEAQELATSTLMDKIGPTVRGAGKVTGALGPVAAGGAGISAMKGTGFEHPFIGYLAGRDLGKATLGPLAEKMKGYNPEAGAMPPPPSMKSVPFGATPEPPGPIYSQFEPNVSGPPEPPVEPGPLHGFETPVDRYLPNTSAARPTETLPIEAEQPLENADIEQVRPPAAPTGYPSEDQAMLQELEPYLGMDEEGIASLQNKIKFAGLKPGYNPMIPGEGKVAPTRQPWGNLFNKIRR